MSAVRMCDSCGTVFPEGIEGSSVGMGVVMIRTADGRRVPEQRQQDKCPPCAEGNLVPQFPKAQAISRGAAKTVIDEDE